MNTIISDPNTLRAVTPTALSTYARTAGWAKAEPYGDYSDVYAGPSLPEIIIPRTQRLGDYALVVAQLIGIFARTSEVSETAIYHDLIIADRDVIRARAPDAAGDGSIDLISGAKLVDGARGLVLAAACALGDPQPLYRAGDDREANDLLRRMRLGQTEHGSFVVTLMTPTIPPPTTEFLSVGAEVNTAPVDRRVTRRLGQALTATRHAAELAYGGDDHAFHQAVSEGVSANLCDALGNMIKPFPTLEISISWAKTRPAARQAFSFSNADAPILRAAARSFRSREPRRSVQLSGSVHTLRRDESDRDGTVTIKARIYGATRSVTTTLTQSDYARAIRAHDARAPLTVSGDLERTGRRWHLHNPRIIQIVTAAATQDEEQQ